MLKSSTWLDFAISPSLVSGATCRAVRSRAGPPMISPITSSLWCLTCLQRKQWEGVFRTLACVVFWRLHHSLIIIALILWFWAGGAGVRTSELLLSSGDQTLEVETQGSVDSARAFTSSSTFGLLFFFPIEKKASWCQGLLAFTCFCLGSMSQCMSLSGSPNSSVMVQSN